jgi:AhpD family alkylhydroperoxidase
MIAESRPDVDRDIEATLGLVPEFFKQVPDYLIPTEWASFKSLQLSDQTAIPNKYKELIGLAVSGATRCRYCCYFHTEAARLFGASEDAITETAMIAKNTIWWSTYLNTLQFDYDEFVEESTRSPRTCGIRWPRARPPDLSRRPAWFLRVSAGRRSAGAQRAALGTDRSRPGPARAARSRLPERQGTRASRRARVARRRPGRRAPAPSR